ncbi:MAG: tetratricopeptide repeat protein [Candidatus Competibacterales bacterium]|nr:tetratricopeptide repeat protein [Candidatus Competibacterales bacterium]
MSLPQSSTPSRNSTCPCGSGRKYKHCCGRGAATASVRHDDAQALASANQALTVAAARQQAGRVDEATAICQRILTRMPKHDGALHQLATLYLQAGKPREALPLLQQAIAANPRNATYHLNLGLAHRALGQLEPALKALVACTQQNPKLAEGHYHHGVLLAALRRHPESVAALRRALQRRRDYPQALARLGAVLATQGSLDEAEQYLQRCLKLQPDNVQAWIDLGNVRVARGQRGRATTCYRKALALDPGNRAALDNQVDNTLKLCDWRPLERLRSDYLEPALEEAATTTTPAGPMRVTQLPIPVSNAELQTIARAMTRVRCRLVEALRQQLGFDRVASREQGRLRIGYMSADFRNHATGHLIQDLFGLHDRADFEIHAYSLGPDDGSPYRQRIQADSDHFHDLQTLDPVATARRIHEDRIDILVDLNVHSGANRLEALALKPAPIQIAYLGYPGTSGTSFMDYILTDRTVTPPDQQPWFDECFVYMPDCYQINSARPEAAATTRDAHGLPESGPVFCCFNASQKLDPTMFDVWMRLLAQTPGSVLWLQEGPEEARDNLRAEARARGIDPERLVFAPRLPVAEHLARLRLADLFLDTRFYNAHTTGSDALWAGVPLITCPGETLAARVGASLLQAVGLPELIADDLADYEAKALQLARDPGERSRLRAHLQARRGDAPLFDTVRFVRHLESAYRRIWARYRAGEAPQAFEVESL